MESDLKHYCAKCERIYESVNLPVDPLFNVCICPTCSLPLKVESVQKIKTELMQAIGQTVPHS